MVLAFQVLFNLFACLCMQVCYKEELIWIKELRLPQTRIGPKVGLKHLFVFFMYCISRER